MKADYEQMSTQELKNELNRLYEEQSDLEREWEFTLCKTPAHLSDGMRKRLDRELNDLKKTIELIEATLRKRGFGTDFLRKNSKFTDV
ncbi:MAG: hypothetical protein QHH75_03160 [Bacillota bacterium]|nr:hypothetical protein [Bacillota bacterium]